MNISLFCKPLAALTLSLACFGSTFDAAAAPVSLFDIDAVVLGTAEDVDSVDVFLVESPPNPLPISGEAVADQAIAFASASGETLFVNAEVFGEAGAGASAVVDALFASPTTFAREFVLAVDVEYGNFGLEDFAVDEVTELLFSVLADGIELLSSALTIDSTWQTLALRERFTLPAHTAGAVTFVLSTDLLGVTSTAEGGVFAVADFAVAAVTEPVTTMMLMLGLTLLSLLRAGRGVATRRND